MGILNEHMLSVVILIPLVAAIACASAPARFGRWMRAGALAAAFVKFALAAMVFVLVDSSGEFDFVERYHWISSIGVSYLVGVDGISALLIAASSLAVMLSILSTIGKGDAGAEESVPLILLVDFALTGALAATDAMLFFAFVQVAVFGAALFAGKSRLPLRFGLLLLVALFSLLFVFAYCGNRAGSYDVLSIYACRFTGAEQLWMLTIFVFSFSILSGIFPFHGWLKAAMQTSGAASSFVICAAFLKLGVYGIMRFALPAFPVATTHLAEPLVIFFIASAIAAAIVAISERDVKALVALTASSISAIAAAGIAWTSGFAVAGSMLYFSASGLCVGALSLMLHSICSARGSAVVSKLRGAALALARGRSVFALLVACAIGALGTAAFSGVYMLFLGAFQTNPLLALAGMLAALASTMPIVFVAVNMFSGGEPAEVRGGNGFGELVALGLAVAVVFAVGLFPKFTVSKLLQPASAFAELATRTRSIEIVPPGDKR